MFFLVKTCSFFVNLIFYEFESEGCRCLQEFYLGLRYFNSMICFG